MKDIAAALRFVRGAVASKEFVPELTYFRIEDGRVMAFNGTLSLNHAIDLDVNIAPKAKFFEKALLTMPEDTAVSITVTQARRLSIKAGNFRVLVQCHDAIADNLFPQPDGPLFAVPPGLEFLPMCKTLYPFIAEDASRPWAQSILLSGGGAYATNNVVLVEYAINTAESNINFKRPFALPLDVVRELIRIGVEPTHMQLGTSSVTFHYPNGAWMRGQLYEAVWPDLTAVINQPQTGLKDAPEGFHADMKRLEQFITDSSSIFIVGTTMRTSLVDGEGAAIETREPLGDGSFHIKVLLKIAAVATRIDFVNRPAVFTAPRLRGVAMPMMQG